MPKPKLDMAALKQPYEKPSKFIKFQSGDTRIRILSDPYKYYVVGKKVNGRYIRQVIEDGVEIAEFLRDVDPKLQYGFVVFDYITESFKVLETGPELGVKLVELVRQKWPDEYKAEDIIVHAQGEALKRKYAASYAPDKQNLPKGVSKDSAEFRFVLSHFEGIR
jgi:hypothetical protein